MPWCPKCGTEYTENSENCLECGAQVPASRQRGGSGYGAPLASGCLFWLLIPCVGLLGTSFLSATPEVLRGAIPILLCGIVGFAAGMVVSPHVRFVPSLVAWLLVSVPVMVVVQLRRSFSFDSPSAAETCAQWASVLLPVLLGPLSVVAGSHFAQRRCLRNLLVWAIPLLMIAIAIGLGFAALPTRPD